MCLRGETDAPVYLPLTFAPLEQPGRRPAGVRKRAILMSALPVATVAQKAVKAAGQVAGHRRDLGDLAVVSADRLNAGWATAQRAGTSVGDTLRSYVETLLKYFRRMSLQSPFLTTIRLL